MKNNGVKLLAAVAVMAMMLAGAFVVIGSDDSDAESANLSTISGLENAVAGDYSAAKKILVSESMAINLKGTADADLDVYLIGGKTLTVTGIESNKLDIKVYVASADATVVNTTITGTFDNAVYLSIDDLVATTVSITSSITGGSSTLVISGDATDAGTIVDTAGVSVGESGFKASVAYIPSNLVYGVAVAVQNASVTYYKIGSNLNTITLAATGDSVKMINGSATVIQGGNTIEMKNLTSNVSSNPIVVSYGTNYPAISGTPVTGELTIKNGVFVNSNFNAGAGSNMVTSSDNITAYCTSQVVSKVSDSNIVNAYVVGNVVQKSSATIAGPITVVNNANYVIIESADVKCTAVTLSSGSILRLMGGINTTTTALAVGSGTILVGPNGYAAHGTTSFTYNTAFSNNTNVLSGNDFKIEGIPSSPSVGDAVLTGNLVIPEKTTFTVNGNLGLNGKSITVNGTLVIAKGGSIYGTNPGVYTLENITLGPNGKIENGGNLGFKSPVNITAGTAGNVTVQGVSGVEFGFKKVGTDDKLAISGDIKAVRNAPVSKVTLDGTNAVIAGELTIGKNVTLDGGANVIKGSVVVINGTITGTYNFGENTELTVNGVYNATANFIVGTYGNDGNITTPAGNVAFTKTVTNATLNGFTIYNKKVAVTGSDDMTTYYLRTYINGVVDVTAVTTGNYSGSLSVTGDVYVANGETLTVKKNAAFSASKVIIEGDITFADDSTDSITSYIGVKYVVSVDGTNPTETTYYTTLDKALAAIDTADEKEIYVKLDNLDTGFEVKAGQTVELTINNNGIVGEESKIVVNNDGTLTGTIPEIQGMLVVMPEASSIVPASYASKKVAADGTTTYSGFAVAVSNAEKGDVIEIDSANVGSETSRKNLTIPADVKVVIKDTLTVYGNVTVPAGAELVGGSIIVNGTSTKTAEIKVAGTMDVSDGSLSGTNNSLSSTGTTVMATPYGTMNGAYYSTTDGYILTTFENAAKSTAETIRLAGTVSEASDVTVSEKNIVLDANSKVTFGKVTLESGSKITATGAELTATISAMDGKEETTGAVSTGVMNVVKTSSIFEAKKTTNAAGVSTYAFIINTISGEMDLTEGTMTVNADLTAVNGSKFIVSEGATMNIIAGNTVIDGDAVEFVANGTVYVTEATITFDEIAGTDKKVPVIAGALNIGKNGTVEADVLSITGTVTVSNTEDATGTFQITDSKVTVGAAPKSIGAAGAIVGPVVLDNGKFIKAFPGSDLSAAQINVPAGGESTAKTTEFYVNDVLYATVYAQGDVNISTVITVNELNKLVGVKELAAADFKWCNAEGDESSATKIGDAEALYITMEVSTVDVSVSVGTGISVYIDGVKYTSGTTAKLTIGTHDVKATVNPGYKGTVTVSFDGQAVSNGKIDVTADMLKQTSVVLSATGDIAIDNGSSSGSSSSNSDDGMGITDILLIVLVILAAILVVIVALRMMRS